VGTCAEARCGVKVEALAIETKKIARNRLNAENVFEPATAIPAFFLKKPKNELNAENLIESPIEVIGEYGGVLI
jgi:hypothetical protein